ncbi:beta-lactamase/transpeptidase-like protein [Crassisporium funariophilum]|nr:beta-lactamase/transpeptidase-like protein [Crassisporium funariophilum]
MATLTYAGTNALDNLVARTVEEKKIPGFVLGVANLLALQSYETGHTCKLSFEDPISNYLPEFSNPGVLNDIMAETPTFKPAKNVMKSVAYGFSSAAIGFVVEKVSGQSLEAYWCGSNHNAPVEVSSSETMFSGKEHIFNPLGMKSSFYRTPDLKLKAIEPAWRNGDGKLEAWANPSILIEQDPTKGMHIPKPHLRLTLYSRPFSEVHRLMGGIDSFIHLFPRLSNTRWEAGKAANPILKLETVQSLFQPTLTDVGAKSLDAFTWLFGTPQDRKCQWSAGLALCLDDWPGRRRKGSAYWAKWAGTYGYIDPSTGIVAVFGTQVIPTADSEVLKVYAEFEEILHAGFQ